jgi:hypothetical protein
MREALEEGEVSLADIGTNEEEVGTMLHDYHRHRAIESLKFARINTSISFSNLEDMREHLSKAGMTLAEIGTSEEEARQLTCTSYKENALYWIESAKRGELTPEGLQITLKDIQKNFQKSGLTFLDIEMSEAEIEKLFGKSETEDTKLNNYSN